MSPPSRSSSGNSSRSGGSPRFAAVASAADACELVFRLLCPAARTGSVIGKGGEVIQLLREATGARIRVEDALFGYDERVICISAPDDPACDWSQAQEALFRVHSRVVEGDGEALPDGVACSVRLLVPERHAGTLLGRGGATIAALREASGCSIRLAPHCAQDSLLSITGDAAAVRSALEQASRLLRAAPRTPASRASRGAPAAAAALAAAVPPALVLGVGGQPALMKTAAARPLQLVSEARGGASAPLTFLAPLPALLATSAPAGAVSSPTLSVSLAPELVYRLLCPVTHVGALLGRGGETVAALRAATGARIKVADALPGSADVRVVTVASADDGGAAPAAAQAALTHVYAAMAGGDAPPSALLLLSVSAAAELRGAAGAQWLAALRASTGCAAQLLDVPPQLRAAYPEGGALLELPADSTRRPSAALAALAAAAAHLRQLTPLSFTAVLPEAAPLPAPVAASNAVLLQQPQEEESRAILLPAAAAGAVIGRGGTQIAALRAATGARVKLHDAAPHAAGARRLCISGSAAQVDAAMVLLARMLADSSPALACVLAAPLLQQQPAAPQHAC